MGNDEHAELQDCEIKYPSGNTAIVVCRGDPSVLTAYTDASKPKVLAMFSTLGVGCVHYSKSGRPWLVVNQKGWTVSDPQGRIVERGSFPRQSGRDIRCEPTEHLQVVFQDLAHITLMFQGDGQTHAWSVGQRLRRSDTAVQQDVSAIRARQAAVGSLYVSRGPHATPTPHTGLGSLRAALGKLQRTGAAELQEVVQGLQTSDSRVQRISTLPLPLYGTSRTASAASSQQLASTTQTMGATWDPHATSASAPGGTSKGRCTVTSPMLPDYGAPDMTSQQRKWQRAGERSRQPPAYQPRRSRLQPISMSEVTQHLQGPGAVRDMLYCVCLLASWSPACATLQPQLEAGWRQLQLDAEREPSGHANHIKVLHLDASTARELQKRLAFRTVPMVIMYYHSHDETHLIFAGNNISTKEELVSACYAALERGRKGEYLPAGFTFAGADNALLNCITPHMTLASR